MRALPALPFLLWAAASPVAAEVAPCPSLSIQGEPAACACSPAAWGELKAGLAQRSELARPQQLAALMHLWLCADGERAARRLQRRMPRHLPRKTQDTGEAEETHLVAREELRPLAGQAWNASWRVDFDAVELSYWSNEACVMGGRFVFRAGRWSLVELGEACD